MEKKLKVYKCYSMPLKEFLTDVEGLEYIAIAFDKKKEKDYFMFIKDEQLDIALTKWTNNNPNKR